MTPNELQQLGYLISTGIMLIIFIAIAIKQERKVDNLYGYLLAFLMMLVVVSIMHII